ncbi:MAG: acetyltransferase [Bacillaceae bacterium]|nr:acetyltransferase [Bacillaceae bacterium]
MKKKLLIIGASGHGKVVADIASKMNRWQSIYFLDDNQYLNFSLGFEVIGKSNEAIRHINDFDIFVGIGKNTVRKKIQESLEVEGAAIPTLIHPNATLGGQVEVAPGTAIMAGVVINCSTKIGKGCIINTGATVDHDNVIEDFVHVSPGVHLAGTVKVGQGSWLGIGSIVSNNINITSNCMVGAGAVVVKDITETGTYVGVPARRV